MELERIRKGPKDCVDANLRDYVEYARTFSWTQARALLDGLPGGGLNIAYEAVDRHVKAGRGNKLALRWIGRDDTIRDFTYAALAAAANRFANVLTQRGIRKGDRVSSLLGRLPELYIGALGTLKNGNTLFLAAAITLALLLQKTFLLMEKRPHCRFNALAFGALVGVQFVAGVFGFNPKKPHPRLALWTIGPDS